MIELTAEQNLFCSNLDDEIARGGPPARFAAEKRYQRILARLYRRMGTNARTAEALGVSVGTYRRLQCGDKIIPTTLAFKAELLLQSNPNSINPTGETR